MNRVLSLPLVVLGLSLWADGAGAAVSPELQKVIRANTFEVVMRKPAIDTATYEKPLPLELLPFRERNDGYRSVGTAFALGHNTYVTAAHVFSAAIDSQYGAPELRAPDSTVYAIDRILRFSQHEDYVVFSLVHDPSPAGLPVNRDPHIDEPVLAVGNALGEGIVIRDGLYTSATDEEKDGRWKWIRFSAAASPGNSGGPLLDADGRVIGIVIGKSPNENLNYSLPIGRPLDGDARRAIFDQRTLTSLPYLHGTRSYSYQDGFQLPLAWPAFVEAYQALIARHDDEARRELLKAYGGSLFPQGPGSEAVLYAADPNDFNPFLITQQDDGAWIATKPDFSSTDLAGDGAVRVGSVPGATLLRVIRSSGASDDAFFSDTKAVMDLALRALNIRRPIGPDQVRITSLGSAKTDAVFSDACGRQWQERVWAVPFLDIFVVGEFLPTPDGYTALVDYLPSPFLREGRARLRLLTGQVGVSLRGTLPQWQAYLHRRTWLPPSLADIKLGPAPGWSVQSSRFTFSPPASAIRLTDKSILSMTMGFALNGSRLAWEVDDIWWAQDERVDTTVGVWRRARPPPTAKQELRNLFVNMQERRAPYDGELIRDSAETYMLNRILEVPGKSIGAKSADLLYGVTVRLAGHPSPGDANRYLQEAVESTHILEHGFGADMAGATSVSGSDPSVNDSRWQQFLALAEQHDAAAGKDIRGHTMSQDFRALYAARNAKVVRTPAGSAEGLDGLADATQRAEALKSYWSFYPALTHNRELWSTFLSRNGMPPDTPHAQEVIDDEKSLLAELSGDVPRPQWPDLARKLLVAYIQERSQWWKTHAPVVADFRSRVSACPAPADKTSGRKSAFYGRMTRSLEDFWPTESRRLGEEGVVRVAVRVAATGCPVAAAIVGSSGSEMLDEAVMKFYETIEFLPGESDGKAIESTVTVPIVFKLKNSAERANQ